MSESVLKIDLLGWVDHAKANSKAHSHRQAVEIILYAIATEPYLKDWLYLKGGTLMGLAYNSPRQTDDIDFSSASAIRADNDTADTFKSLMNPSLQEAAMKLHYPDIVMRVQTTKGRPPKKYPNCRFPSLEIKIAYAQRHSPQEDRLREGRASDTIELSISFNEEIDETQVLQIANGASLRAYSFIDLAAEKYRALLQQPKRNRYRRQDVYDLDILVRTPELGDDTKSMILVALVKKCKSRDISANPRSIDSPQIKRRAGFDWSTMELELEKLPEFDVCFDRVAAFYRQLPWAELS